MMKRARHYFALPPLLVCASQAGGFACESFSLRNKVITPPEREEGQPSMENKNDDTGEKIMAHKEEHKLSEGSPLIDILLHVSLCAKLHYMESSFSQRSL